MTGDDLTLAIDAGTSVIKAVVFDGGGDEKVVVSRPTALSSPHPGWIEQDMAEVREMAFACAAEAARRAPGTISRIALTAQGDGAWMIRGDGQPARPAVLWNDARAVQIVDRWTDDGRLEEAFRINGSLGNLGLPHAILSWFLENDPDALADVRDVVTCGSWLFESLTGRRGLHPSEASAPWLDVRTGQYSEEIIELFDLADIKAKLPVVLGARDLTAALSPRAAREMRLQPGLPVTLAPYDVLSTAVGGGCVATGSAFCILGTTLCTGIITEAPDTQGAPTGLTLLGIDGSRATRVFPTLAGTEVVHWARGVMGLAAAEEVTALAARSVPGARGVRVLPYLAEAGERMPFLDPDARGAILGLKVSTRQEDVARGVLEGLAHTIRDCLDASGAHPRELILSGGGSASEVWCQVIADVTGVPVVRVQGTQIGAKGAMMYAAVANGSFSDLEEAAERVVIRGASYAPDPGVREFFDERHTDFLRTRVALAERWVTWRTTDKER
ncbi:FGGY family carbohydrate kinase [Microbacterium sp. ET2]|uniref:FGGY family carbohydrate kinase n=1 Tax=Microbacterium albipurpureum TaxID=3050384 RepID=UPI00259D0A83|nr:FGGY family carbohydrate kinase [Microbacterium sp. ET2 (Ac-2212)]WJL96991.1 FGGY family carbohydrate kinase [Microbacterium sp. ET2 (Ac-2212)]